MKKFKLDFSFVILLGIISLSPKQNLVLKLFLCLFLHELGHLLFVLIFRYKIHSLKLSIFGFFLELDRTKEVFYKDFLIYLGGILSNLLCYIFIPDPQIKAMSFILIVFNSLPIYPLDGFNVIKTLASYVFPYRFVLRGMSYLSLLGSLFIFLLCMFYKMDVFLLINAFYLILLSIEYYWNWEIAFQKFMLEKLLYGIKYPIKKIRFHINYKNYFYKYHTIHMQVGNKIIPEEELFLTKST